ncbi:50S ribosomal protein L14e [Candidatus Woesearchaeota archaeon]|nr:50S ribosomal protein L14e [Candidatus Woesearchaeota archaeon]
MVFEIGRVCVKIAGRDSNRRCVIVDTVDDKIVLIDGDVRRRKCNVIHLEPLDSVIKIKKGASHSEVAKEFKDLGFNVWETKPRKTAERPKKVRKVKEKPAEEEKPAKKKAEKPKKEEKKEEAEETELEKIAETEEKPKKKTVKKVAKKE